MKTPAFNRFASSCPALRAVLLGSTFFAAVTTTHAQSTWTGDTINNTDNSWGTVTNWSPSEVPGTAIFTSASASGYSVVLGDANRTATITFDSTTGSNPYTIRLYDTDLTTRRVLNVGGVTVDAGNHTFLGAKVSSSVGDFRPQNNAVFNIASGTSLNLDVRLRHGATSHVYSKTGEGTLILSANNGGSSAWQFSEGAGFAVQNGVLRLAAAGAAGHTGNKYVVSNGAALELSASFGAVNAAQTISGNGIGNSGAIRSLSGDLTFGNNPTNAGTLILAADSGIGVDAGSLNIGLAIGESGGSRSLTKVGNGTLILSNANTFTGSTTISAGLLSLTNLNALQNSPFDTGNSMVGDTTNGLRTNQTTLNLGGLSGDKPLADVFTTDTGGYDGVTAITLTTGTGKNPSYAGVIDGGRSLTKAGPGAQALSGSNTYTGGTTITEGGLSFLNTNAKSPTGTHAFGPATTLGLGVSGDNPFTATDIDNAFAGTMTGNLSGITLDASTLIGIDTTLEDFLYTAVIDGSRGFVKLGTNTLTLTGSNTYTGGTTVSAGTLTLGNATNTLADTGAVNVSGGTLDIGANSDTVGAITLTSGSITGTTGVLTGSSYAAGSGTISAILGGSAALTKTGTGTLTLSGNNTFSGGIDFSGTGVLALAQSNAAGTGTISFASTRISTDTAATFTLSGGINVANNIVIDAATGRNTINSINGSNTLSGNITITNANNFVVFQNQAATGSGTTFTIGGATPNSTTISASTYSSSISFRASQTGELGVLNSRINAPNASFNINNRGFWTINSSGNVWTATTLSTADSTIQLGVNDALATGARIEMSSSSTVDLNGFNQTAAGLGGSGTGAQIRNDSDTTDSILTLSGLTADRNFVGGIIDGDNGRKVSLVMNDSSGFTQTLTGPSTYSGNTTITSGTLILAAANPENEASTVTIADSNATLTLNFEGTDTVGKLFIGETQVASGTYGTEGSEAPVIGIPQITGTGTLFVSNGPGDSGFASWQTANTTTGGLNDDHDNDGVDNGIEYFLGGPNGNTTGFTALPGVTNTAGTLSVTWTKGSGYTGAYPTDFWVETSATLAEPWTKETLGGGNITNDSGSVKYTFPSPLGAKRFARLKVTGP
jgi:autotransporter-associated beta strand protein